MKFMRKHKELFTPDGQGCYNSQTREENSGKSKKEEKTMTQLLERLEQYEIPPHIEQQLGLSKDWKKSVSSELLQHLLESLQKYENVMKRLSDK